MTAYYNENDHFAAAWLRELIKAGLIAHGIVDERSIEDVTPNDLTGFIQLHWFAGIGGWSLALRLTGWPDSRPVWTGSCPCQSFSAAGKGAGFNDSRHLWPAFFNLIKECRPHTVFGEQVEAAIRHGWLDLVQNDLEREGYAVGAVVFPAAGVGAPHIRSRLYWVADSNHDRRDKGWERVTEAGDDGVIGNGTIERLADSQGKRSNERQQDNGGGSCGSDAGEGAECVGGGAVERLSGTGNGSGQQSESWATERGLPAETGRDVPREPTGPTNGQWRNADWLFCRDGKWRPVESIDVEMVDGLSDRLGYSRFGDRYSVNPLIQKAENRAVRLKGYGNSIVPAQAAEFIISVDQAISMGYCCD